MSRFLPKSARHVYPECVDLKELFENEKYDVNVGKVISYLAKIHASHSDGSNERIFRENTVTEVFYVATPTRDAYIAEIEFCNALGKENVENIKVYLQKYLDTHTYVYGENFKRVKAGKLYPWTGKDVGLYLLNRYSDNARVSSQVVNAIQLWFVTRIEAEMGINANYSIVKL